MLRHLNDAVLRRYVDEPDALLSYEKEHLVQCLRCRRTLDAVRLNARSVVAALSDTEEPYDLAATRASIIARAQRLNEETAISEHTSHRTTRDWRWLSAIAAVAVFTMLFSYAPFRAYAQNLLTIFEPREVTPISITRADLEEMHGIPQLRELGTVQETGGGATQRFTSSGAAEQYARQVLVRPSYLPGSVAHTVEYRVHPSKTVRFTFDERKAKASAARRHFTLPPPPAGLDGATFTAEVGPIMLQSYGADFSKLHGKNVVPDHEFPRNAIIIAQAPVPSVQTTSVAANTIESYLLSLPNVPEDVKAQIRAIRDPASALPIPFAVDKTTAQPVMINGTRGLLIGDNTGVGGVVIWVTGGKVYSVAGGYTADEITRVANSMIP